MLRFFVCPNGGAIHCVWSDSIDTVAEAYPTANIYSFDFEVRVIRYQP